MLRNLLTPEAHKDPYVWAAVFVAHFGIGVMILIVSETLLSGIRAEHFDVIPLAFGAVFSAAVLAGIAYAAFVAIQAVISRSRLIWDSVLDWTGVMIGAAAVNYLMAGQAIPGGRATFTTSPSSTTNFWRNWAPRSMTPRAGSPTSTRW